MFNINNLKRQKKQKSVSYNIVKAPLTFNNNLKVGTIFIKSLSFYRINQAQLESLFQFLNKVIKKIGKVICLIFPSIPLTKKPNENRMGKGKGSIHSWVFKLKPGSILFEIVTKTPKFILKSLKKINYKSPIKLKIHL